MPGKAYWSDIPGAGRTGQVLYLGEDLQDLWLIFDLRSLKFRSDMAEASSLLVD